MKAAAAAGYGILAALGASTVGIEVPAVHSTAQHILIGIAVALVYYSRPDETPDSDIKPPPKQRFR